MSGVCAVIVDHDITDSFIYKGDIQLHFKSAQEAIDRCNSSVQDTGLHVLHSRERKMQRRDVFHGEMYITADGTSQKGTLTISNAFTWSIHKYKMALTIEVASLQGQNHQLPVRDNQPWSETDERSVDLVLSGIPTATLNGSHNLNPFRASDHWQTAFEKCSKSA